MTVYVSSFEIDNGSERCPWFVASRRSPESRRMKEIFSLIAITKVIRIAGHNSRKVHFLRYNQASMSLLEFV